MPTTILITLAMLVSMQTCGGVAGAFNFQADSAHGNGSYGVNRSGTPATSEYDIGECTHCHDTYDESICGVNDLMLFSTPVFASQSDAFCYECHKTPSNSVQVNMPYQRSYSRKIGGDTTITCPNHIRAAFRFVNDSGQPRLQCDSSIGSSHFLDDVGSYLANKWGFDSNPDNIDPCHGCHNPHRAQRHDYPSGSIGGSPVSRPSTHNGDWAVYGADPSERMDRYTYPYEPPYTVDLGREWPTTGDGASAPDINTVCLDCHSGWGVMSTRYGELMALGSSGGMHGASHGTPKYFYGGLDAPYQDFHYVTLMCTDCHEPHGSPNEKLLRSCVNGKQDIVVLGPGQWLEFCTACHHLSESGASWHKRKPLGNFDETTDCRSSCHQHFFH